MYNTLGNDNLLMNVEDIVVIGCCLNYLCILLEINFTFYTKSEEENDHSLKNWFKITNMLCLCTFLFKIKFLHNSALIAFCSNEV